MTTRDTSHDGVDPRPGDPDYPFDPMELLSEGMAPMPEGTDVDRVKAAYDLIGRTGATDVEVGYDDDYDEPSWWYATCSHGKVAMGVVGRKDIIDAIEGLARKLINGGTCTHCGSTMALSRKGLGLGDRSEVCLWTREGTRWERGCRDSHEEGKRQAAIVEEFLSRAGIRKRSS